MPAIINFGEPKRVSLHIIDTFLNFLIKGGPLSLKRRDYSLHGFGSAYEEVLLRSLLCDDSE